MVRLTDHPDMIIYVYRGRKITAPNVVLCLVRLFANFATIQEASFLGKYFYPPASKMPGACSVRVVRTCVPYVCCLQIWNVQLSLEGLQCSRREGVTGIILDNYPYFSIKKNNIFCYPSLEPSR